MPIAVRFNSVCLDEFVFIFRRRLIFAPRVALVEDEFSLLDEPFDDARERSAWLIGELASRLEGPPGETVHPNAGADPGVVYRIVLDEKAGRFERRL